MGMEAMSLSFQVGDYASFAFRLILKNSNKFSNSYSFTKLACNATLLSGWVTPQGMLAPKTWAQRAFLKRIIDLHSRK